MHRISEYHQERSSAKLKEFFNRIMGRSDAEHHTAQPEEASLRGITLPLTGLRAPNGNRRMIVTADVVSRSCHLGRSGAFAALGVPPPLLSSRLSKPSKNCVAQDRGDVIPSCILLSALNGSRPRTSIGVVRPPLGVVMRI